MKDLNVFSTYAEIFQGAYQNNIVNNFNIFM